MQVLFHVPTGIQTGILMIMALIDTEAWRITERGGLTRCTVRSRQYGGDHLPVKEILHIEPLFVNLQERFYIFELTFIHKLAAMKNILLFLARHIYACYSKRLANKVTKKPHAFH